MVPDQCRDGDDGQSTNPTRVLLDRARNGDQRAFNQLYSRYYLALTGWAHGRLCASARGQNETRDLVHISFQKAFISLDRFEYRHQGSFLGFLHEILRNEVASTNRKVMARKPNVDVDGDLLDPSPDALTELLQRERLELYERAMRTLSPKEQELIRMREMGLKFAEIAVEAELRTPNAARMAVTRAVARLADVLRGMTHESA